MKKTIFLLISTYTYAFYAPIHTRNPTIKILGNTPTTISKTSVKLNPNDIDFQSNFKAALLVNSAGYLLLQNPPQNSLTPDGLLHASVLGIGIWTFLGWEGFFICVSYLIFGSLVTKIGFKEKEALGIAEKRGGRRGPENVWGSAATGMLCAIMTYVVKDNPNAIEMIAALKIAYVASLTTKLSDTFQSEIGKVYGKTTVLITNLERVEPGTEGAISLEGYAAGIIGSIILTSTANNVGFIDNWEDSTICLVAPLIATTIESYIGATSQNKVDWLSNELVNFINTLVGATLGIGGYYLVH